MQDEKPGAPENRHTGKDSTFSREGLSSARVASGLIIGAAQRRLVSSAAPYLQHLSRQGESPWPKDNSARPRKQRSPRSNRYPPSPEQARPADRALNFLSWQSAPLPTPRDPTPPNSTASSPRRAGTAISARRLTASARCSCSRGSAAAAAANFPARGCAN